MWPVTKLLAQSPDGVLHAALEVISGMSTAQGATLAAMAATTGDSFAVRAFDLSKKAYLLQAWAAPQAAGNVRIKSPKFHDNVNGIRYKTTSADFKPFMPWGAREVLFPTDVLSVDFAGSAVAGKIEYVAMLLYYEDCPGTMARLLKRDELLARVDHILTVENTISTPTTGGYAAAQSINTTIDQFQAGADYAVLGYKCNTATPILGYKCAEFGNVRIGVPGDASDFDLYSDWFLRLAFWYGLACVPVFNGQNKASVSIDAAQDDAGADPVITTWLAKLKSA